MGRGEGIKRMLIAENDEARRSRIWWLTILVSSALIVIITIYLLMKMFTTNPLEGKWESEDGDFTLGVGRNGKMTVALPDIAEGVDADVEMSYTLNMDDKTVTIQENGAELDRLAAESEGAYTRETLESALSGVMTTFDYSVEGEQLTLTEREYGEQLTFIKK